MYTLILVTAVVTSLVSEPTPHASSQLRKAPYKGVSALQVPRLHLLEMASKDPGDGEAANRIILEFLAGAGLGALGGGLTAWALGADAGSFSSLVLPMSIWMLGSSVGVSLVGAGMEGRGRWAYAIMGSLLGTVAPVGIALGMIQLVNCVDRHSNVCARTLVVSLLGLLVFPAVGATVGYELSAPKSWLLLADSSQKRTAPPRVVPMVSMARQGLGGTVGLAWTM